MSCGSYFTQLIATLQQVQQTEEGAIRAAAKLMVEAVKDGRAIYSFGARHDVIVTEDLVYKAGGLMLVNPVHPEGMDLSVRPLSEANHEVQQPQLGRELLDRCRVGKGDVLLLTSTLGRDAAPVEMALAAQEAGMKTICITSLAETNAARAGHRSGKKLKDVCDLVIDNGAPYGDAAVKIAKLDQKVGPVGGVASCAIANAIVCETIDRLVYQGYEPPVFKRGDLPGAGEYNQRLLAENRHRIHYL